MRQHVFATTSRKRRQKRYARNAPFRAVLAASGGLTTTLTSGFDFYYSAPDRERSIVMSVSVWLFVCLCVFVYVRDHVVGTTRPIFTNFCARYLWPWLGPPLVA